MSRKKELESVVAGIADGIADVPTDDEGLICEALGRVAAVLLAEYDDEDFEVWITAVRGTRNHVRTHGQLD